MCWVSLPETHMQEPSPPCVQTKVSRGPGNKRGPAWERVVPEAGGVGPLPSVCNAGRGLLGPLEAHSADAVGSVLDVNVVGTVRMLQAFLPDMKRRGSGHILVTASMGGLMGEWKRRGLVRLARRAPCGSAPQQLHLPLKGCLSTLFTAPASSRSKVYARVWQFCCCPSGSSELPPSPWNPLNPDFGNTHTRLVGVVPRRSPWPLSTAAHICCVPGTVLGPWHKCDER